MHSFVQKFDFKNWSRLKVYFFFFFSYQYYSILELPRPSGCEELIKYIYIYKPTITHFDVSILVKKEKGNRNYSITE